MKKQKVICIIPARGGSRAEDEKFAKVNNKPLIYFPIKAAFKSGVCDKICVSTDSLQIAKVSKKYGAEVPFLRKKKFAR